MDGLSRDLADHRFSELFQDALGWDQSSIKLAIEVNDQELAFEGVAQKCGFQVMTCRADRRVLGDEALLRKAQGEVARSVHNHILIYSCDKTPEQVWQWGVRIADGRGLRHTEHPFPAASPPDALLKRLNGLRFSVDERDGLSPVEGLHRVRTALVDLPIRKQLATRSDELAVAMARGDNDAYHEFIMLHTGLARVLSKWVLRAYGVDAEDASQMGMLGLIEAARRFDPGHKIKFSTYANHWINKVCRYDGPNAERTIRISRRARRTFFPLRRQLEDLTVQHGPGRTRDELAGWCAEDAQFYGRWVAFDRALTVFSYSDRSAPASEEARKVPAALHADPLQAALHGERIDRIKSAISFLGKRERRVVCRRFGMDGEAWSYQDIARAEGIGRRAARRLVILAQQKLRSVIRGEFPDLEPRSLEPGAVTAGLSGRTRRSRPRRRTRS